MPEIPQIGDQLFFAPKSSWFGTGYWNVTNIYSFVPSHQLMVEIHNKSLNYTRQFELTVEKEN